MSEPSLLSPAIADYVHAHTTEELPLFARLREETYRDLSFPQMQVGRVEGAFLRMMVQITAATQVIEIGTFSGYSTLSLASGLPEDGRLITCDIDPVATTVARRYFDESPWGDAIELRLGPAIDSLASLAAEDTRFDLAFIDADKENYVAYWEALIPMMRPGAVVLADNTLWSGRVLAPERASDHAIVRFNDHVHADERVDNVLLSVRDGVMMARVRPR